MTTSMTRLSLVRFATILALFATANASAEIVTGPQQPRGPQLDVNALKQVYDTFLSNSFKVDGRALRFDQLKQLVEQGFKGLACLDGIGKTIADQAGKAVKSSCAFLNQMRGVMGAAAKEIFKTVTTGTKNFRLDVDKVDGGAEQGDAGAEKVPDWTKAWREGAAAKVQAVVLDGVSSVMSVPDRFKNDVKDLLWYDLHSPLDDRNDRHIRDWFERRMDEGLFNGPTFQGISPIKLLPDADRAHLSRMSADVLATLAIPVVRVFQVIRTKLKGAIWQVVKLGMTASVDFNQDATNIVRSLGLTPTDAGVETISKVAYTVGTIGGAFGKYMTEAADPKIAQVFTEVANSLANASYSMEEAMGQMVEVATLMGGDPNATQPEESTVLDEARRIVACVPGPARARRPSESACPATIAASEDTEDCSGVTDEIKNGLRPLIQKADAFPKDKKVAVSKARTAAFTNLKLGLAAAKSRLGFAVKRARIECGIERILKSVKTAFVTFATPQLMYVAQMINQTILNPILQELKGDVTDLLTLIPTVGGTVSLIWDVVATAAIPILLDIPPRIIIPITVDIIGEEITSFRDNFMKEWDKPRGKRTLEKFMGIPMGPFGGVFQVAKSALDGLRTGMEEGVGGVVRGPLIAMLTKRLPPGLATLVAAAVDAVLTEMAGETSNALKNTREDGIEAALNNLSLLQPDKMKAMIVRVLEKIQPKLKDFLILQVPTDPNDSRRGLIGGLGRGFNAAFGTAIEKIRQSPDFGSLFQLNVLRDIVADFVEGATPVMTPASVWTSPDVGIVDYLLGRLRDWTGNDCVPKAREGIIGIVKDFFVPAIRGSSPDEIWDAFMGGNSGPVGPTRIFARLITKGLEQLKDANGNAIPGTPGDGPVTALLLCKVDEGRWKERFRTALNAAPAILG